eukprot:gene57628-biopygen2192
MPQNPDPPLSYNKSKTYLTIIVGDGDNVKKVKGPHKVYLQNRVAGCKADPGKCYPLVWSMSPQLLHLAPDWLRWYRMIDESTHKPSRGVIDERRHKRS